MAVSAPMPSARAATTARVNPGFLRNMCIACFRSARKVSTTHPRKSIVKPVSTRPGSATFAGGLYLERKNRERVNYERTRKNVQKPAREGGASGKDGSS